MGYTTSSMTSMEQQIPQVNNFAVCMRCDTDRVIIYRFINYLIRVISRYAVQLANWNGHFRPCCFYIALNLTTYSTRGVNSYDVITSSAHQLDDLIDQWVLVMSHPLFRNGEFNCVVVIEARKLITRLMWGTGYRWMLSRCTCNCTRWHMTPIAISPILLLALERKPTTQRTDASNVCHTSKIRLIH